MHNAMSRLAAPEFAERAAAIAVLVVSCVAYAAREYQDHLSPPLVAAHPYAVVSHDSATETGGRAY